MKKVTCEYCGGKFAASELRCPNCGARNPLPDLPAPAPDAPSAAPSTASSDSTQAKENYAGRRPHSLEELKVFAETHKLPSEHFVVGEDSNAPKVFGVFRDTDGNFVVYKNKADGQRTVRYRGPSETAAVDELYHKMVELLAQQIDAQKNRTAETRRIKSHWGTASPRKQSHTNRRPNAVAKKIAVCYLFIVLFVVACWQLPRARRANYPQTGYYIYENKYYYYRDSWYQYDDGWVYVPRTALDGTFSQEYRDYYYGSAVDSVGNDVPAFDGGRDDTTPGPNRSEAGEDGQDWAYVYDWDDDHNREDNNDWYDDRNDDNGRDDNDDWGDDDWDDDWDWDDDVDWDSDW